MNPINKEIISFLIFSLITLWIILLPVIFILKIKFLKKVRNKPFRGASEIFSIFSMEWWIAWLFLPIPILGKKNDFKVEKIRIKVNGRILAFYTVITVQFCLIAICDMV